MSQKYIKAILFFLLLLSISHGTFSQLNILKGTVLDSTSKNGVPYIGVDLYKDTELLKAIFADSLGQFSFESLAPGTYTIAIGNFSKVYRDGIRIPQDAVLRITYPARCLFRQDKHLPCVNNHHDNIIPIVYGLPNAKMMNMAKNGLIQLGGCIISECDPHFYCKTHKREL